MKKCCTTFIATKPFGEWRLFPASVALIYLGCCCAEWLWKNGPAAQTACIVVTTEKKTKHTIHHMCSCSSRSGGLHAAPLSIGYLSDNRSRGKHSSFPPESLARNELTRWCARFFRGVLVGKNAEFHNPRARDRPTNAASTDREMAQKPCSCSPSRADVCLTVVYRALNNPLYRRDQIIEDIRVRESIPPRKNENKKNKAALLKPLQNGPT